MLDPWHCGAPGFSTTAHGFAAISCTCRHVAAGSQVPQAHWPLDAPSNEAACRTWVHVVDTAVNDADDDAAAALCELVRLRHVHLLHVPARHSPGALHDCASCAKAQSPEG